MTAAQQRPADLVDVEGVRAGVEAQLSRHLRGLSGLLASVGPDTAELGEALAAGLSGGKRLRAAFCYWSWRAHGGQPGGPDAEHVLRVGAALELFQAAALFHDDVMDGSDTRRGRPAAHHSFAARHRTAGRRADADRFGENAAILLGDLALVASDHEFSAAVAPMPPAVAAGARAVFDRMRAEVSAGQYLDILGEVLPWGDDPAADEARARQVIRAKSARYSVEHPVTLGAVLAGADGEQLADCHGFGLPLGEAFQLRDDLLGVFGDPAVTGKPAGDDLREGKRTVLVARALARAGATSPTADLIRSQVGHRDLDPASVQRVAEAIAATGAPAEIENLIGRLVDEAFARLDAAELTEPGRAMLRDLGAAAVGRPA